RTSHGIAMHRGRPSRSHAIGDAMNPGPGATVAPPLSDRASRSLADPPHLTLLRVLLTLSIASTAIHYTHNFLMADMYPTMPVVFPTALSYQIAIAIFWPLLTARALWAYRQYTRGELRRAGQGFIAYSFLGITTVGHFLGGVPDIPPFFFVTIF